MQTSLLAQPIPQPMPMCLGLQNFEFSPTNRHQKLQSTPPHPVLSILSLCLLASLEAPSPHDVVKRLPLSCDIPLGSRMFVSPPYLCNCTRLQRVTLDSTSIESSWSNGLLRGSSILMRNCTCWTLRENLLLIFALLESLFLSVNSVSSKFNLLCAMITVFLQVA